MKTKSDIKRVAVFSDTHGNRKEIYKTISHMGHFDLIIHLGDGVADGNNVAEEFGIQFCGIKGNEDHGMDYPISRALNINRWVFFMLHGNQTEINPYQMKSEYDRHIMDMCDMAKRENGDVLLFGHTHKSMLEKRDDTIICNPGDQYAGSASPPTFAVMNISDRILEISLMERTGDKEWNQLSFFAADYTPD
jgi:uncharacterized protein